jgi:hypothetical protein
MSFLVPVVVDKGVLFPVSSMSLLTLYANEPSGPNRSSDVLKCLLASGSFGKKLAWGLQCCSVTHHDKVAEQNSQQ